MVYGFRIWNGADQLSANSLEDGFDRIEIGGIRRNVVDLCILLDEHAGNSRHIPAVVSVDRVHVDYEIELLVFSLNVPAEGILPQIHQELLQDLVKPVPVYEPVLQMKVKNPINGAGDHYRHCHLRPLLPFSEAAAHLIQVNQRLSPLN